MANAYQQQHDLSVATVHVALDHDACREVAVLKGKTAEAERFAERIIAERGARHAAWSRYLPRLKAHGTGMAIAHCNAGR